MTTGKIEKKKHKTNIGPRDNISIRNGKTSFFHHFSLLNKLEGIHVTYLDDS